SASSLHNAPDAADLAEGDAHFSQRAAASIPAVVGDCQGAAVPAAGAPPRLALLGEAVQQQAAGLLGPGVTGIVSQVQEVTQGQCDLVRWCLQGTRRDERGLLLWRRCLWGAPEKLATRGSSSALDWLR